LSAEPPAPSPPAPSQAQGSQADALAAVAAHGKAEARLREAVQAAEQLAGASSRHRTALEAVSERQRAVVSKAGDLRAGLTRLADPHARLSVLGLNAGLEGARIDGPAGRALLMVAEEVRSLAGRASGASTDVDTALSELGSELAHLDAQLAEARGTSTRLVEGASHALGAVHEAQRGLSSLGERLMRATGLDPETAAALESAEAHARELAAALTRISARNHQVAGAEALGRALAPLLAQLTELTRAAPPER
jgi:chromosome segregation ATPase